jgi:hypothetical protein
MYGGDSAYPPETPLRFAIVSYYLSGSYRFRRMPQRRGLRHCRSPKQHDTRVLEDNSQGILRKNQGTKGALYPFLLSQRPERSG